jgi:hypothetical protein
LKKIAQMLDSEGIFQLPTQTVDNAVGNQPAPPAKASSGAARGSLPLFVAIS